jgi:signal transduction histidine kinase
MTQLSKIADGPQPEQIRPTAGSTHYVSSRKRISVKLARYGVAVAFFLGIITSAVQIFQDLSAEADKLDSNVVSVLEMARPPAIAAARSLDDTQAAQIINGLMTYEFVVNAQIVSDLGEVLASRTMAPRDGATPSIARFISGEDARHIIPLVDAANNNARYGEMIVSIDPSLALAGFFERSGFIIIAGILRNFLLAFAMFGIFHWLIARPLIRLNASIADVNPRKPDGQRIEPDSNHSDDEFGMLVENINDFIAATDEHLAERSRAESALKTLNEELEQRVAARTESLNAAQSELIVKERLATLGQLTATVSHELRNPLGAMRISTHVLRSKMDTSDDVQVRAVDRVERCIKRCDNIIDELLDYSRIKDLDRTMVSIDAWLDALLDEQVLPDGIVLERALALPDEKVSLDPERFRRAVINVYENACQAMTGNNETKPEPETGDTQRQLRVATRATGDRVEIVISDNGPGVSDEVLAQIFEPLFSTKNFGVGLGLPTVKHIVEQHGGDIEVETEVSRGTSFVLWIPRSRQEAGII